MGICLSSPAKPVADCEAQLVKAQAKQKQRQGFLYQSGKLKELPGSVSGSTQTFSNNTSPYTSSGQNTIAIVDELVELLVPDYLIQADEEDPTALGHPYEYHAHGPMLPPCDAGRLETIRSLAALNPSLLHSQVDAPPDPEVACILKLVASIFNAPAVLVALFEDKRIFVRDTEGNFERGDFPWRWSFCAWTLASQADSIMVIEDAHKDARFCDNAMVRGPAGIRFYCGAPLLASNGHRLGTLCIADQKPRTFDASSCAILNNMAELVVRHVERDIMLQLRKQDNSEMVRAYAQMQRTMDCSSQCVMLVDTRVEGWKVLYANEALVTVTGQGSTDVVGQLLADLIILPITSCSSSSNSTKCPTTEHLRLAELGTQFEITGVRLRSCHQSDSRDSNTQHSSSHSNTSAMSDASSAENSYVLSLRPACQGDFDGDAMSIGIPSYVPRTHQPDNGSVVEPERFFFLSIRKTRSPMLSRPQDSLTHSQAGSLSSASVVFGDSIEGLVTGHLLGKGAFGSVYYGTWFGTPVAVKVVDQDIRALQKKSLARMHADANNSEGTSLEAVLGQELQHPHIVSTLTYTIKTIDTSAVPQFPPTNSHRNKGKDRPADVKAAEASAKADAKWEVQTLESKTAELKTSEAKPPSPVHATATKSSSRLGGKQIVFAATPQPAFVRGSTGGCQPVVDSFQCIDSFGASGNYFMINSDSEKLPVEEPEDADALGLKQYQSWIVMEYCDRGSLQDAVDKGWLRTERSNLSGVPYLPAILVTAHEIASAMCFLHSRGVIHGDLSAWNVLLSASGPSASAAKRGFVAKIADFGLARDLDVRTKIQTRTYGTLTHMPPETLSNGFISKATDIYSFGVLLWQMMTGSRPWSGQNHVQIVVLVAQRKRMLQFPPGTMPLYVRLAEECMAFDHEQRPSFEECEARLSAMLEANPAD